MPPVTILSPYSGRPVKVRENDLGRALRDEQGRVFYVVEDPEHGRYAARTRKGSPKDLERYREIEAGVAKLEGEPEMPEVSHSQVYDATGAKRRNPLGLLLLLIVFAAVVGLGYVYLNHPDWLGLGTPAGETQDDPTSQIKPRIIQAVADSGDPHTITPEPVNAHAPDLDAMPLSNDATKHRKTPQRDPQPHGVDDDPEPVFVAATNRPEPTARPNTAPRQNETAPVRTVPITQPTTRPSAEPRQPRYDDFHHTASGLRYKITHLTDGVSARAGNYLTVRYTAQTLDGEPLINDATQSFILARGQAIRAFDEGLAGIREGEQLRLLVPRGHSENGTLPGIDRIPDQPFLLDVQLVSVRPGVTYIIETPGEIDARPCMPGDTIYLNYIARVEGRDEVIDATVHRGQPMRITLGNDEVIKGLELGITGMRPGESRQLTIPPYLAYGKHSVAGGLIPENAVLSFRVTLVGIVEDEQ